MDGGTVHGGLKIAASDDELIGGKVILASDDKLIGGKVILACDNVGVIRGGGGASDAKQMADRQSDKIGAASNTRDWDNPPVRGLLRRAPDCLVLAIMNFPPVLQMKAIAAVEGREKSAWIDSRCPRPTVGANCRGSYDTYTMRDTSRQ
jgi:hypothetical protein